MSVCSDRFPSCSGTLCDAAKHRHADCVKNLIKLGADVNHHDRYGDTSLMKAAGGGNSDCMKILCAGLNPVSSTI